MREFHRHANHLLSSFPIFLSKISRKLQKFKFYYRLFEVKNGNFLLIWKNSSEKFKMQCDNCSVSKFSMIFNRFSTFFHVLTELTRSEYSGRYIYRFFSYFSLTLRLGHIAARHFAGPSPSLTPYASPSHMIEQA